MELISVLQIIINSDFFLSWFFKPNGWSIEQCLHPFVLKVLLIFTFLFPFLNDLIAILVCLNNQIIANYSGELMRERNNIEDTQEPMDPMIIYFHFSSYLVIEEVWIDPTKLKKLVLASSELK